MHTPLHRRTFLQASGISLALPLLESMSSAFGATAAPAPKRMVLVCTSLGLHPPALWPKTTGSDYETTEYLKVLKEHRADYTLFSGLCHQNQTGRQPHDSELTFLTAAEKPGMAGFRNSISVDQVAANKLGYVTRFPSLALSTNSTMSQSYTGGGVMIPAETSPAQLFAKLFLKGKPGEVAKQRRQLNTGRSILDQLGAEAARIRKVASKNDNELLSEYFEAVRKAELDIAEVQGWMDKEKPTVKAKQPTDVADPSDLVGRTQRLMDLIPLIVQTDSSRVITVMIQDHFVVPKIEGVSGNHHNLSHHGQDPKKIEQLRKIETSLLECFGSLLAQLKSRKEQGGRLLDQTSVLLGSNLGNANAHHARNLPIFVAGGGFKHGQYVANKSGTPLCNLFVTLLNKMGVEAESFGQSKGTLTWG